MTPFTIADSCERSQRLLKPKRQRGIPRRRYPTDPTDAQWMVLEPMLPAAKPGGRPRKHALRDILDAMRYVLRGGIA